MAGRPAGIQVIQGYGDHGGGYPVVEETGRAASLADHPYPAEAIVCAEQGYDQQEIAAAVDEDADEPGGDDDGDQAGEEAAGPDVRPFSFDGGQRYDPCEQREGAGEHVDENVD